MKSDVLWSRCQNRTMTLVARVGESDQQRHEANLRQSAKAINAYGYGWQHRTLMQK